ncbi:MAG: hypothetical protein ISS95_00770 [Candidatus Aenigmarchaeota archaeon]|nr:hypothetical protein [Candidatus Aenigmarchaeota archaeon]
MVMARAKLLIQDYIQRPWVKTSIKFKGVNPERFYKEVPKVMTNIFRVHEGQIQEKAFSWDRGDPEKFKVVWEMDKELDRFSYYMIKVKFSGVSSKGVGKADFLIDALLRTEYPQDTFWEKSLLYEFMRMLWHNMFYTSKREEYIKEGRRLLAMFYEDMKRITHKG